VQARLESENDLRTDPQLLVVCGEDSTEGYLPAIKIDRLKATYSWSVVVLYGQHLGWVLAVLRFFAGYSKVWTLSTFLICSAYTPPPTPSSRRTCDTCWQWMKCRPGRSGTLW
jgi:hypothetical protein